MQENSKKVMWVGVKKVSEKGVEKTVAQVTQEKGNGYFFIKERKRKGDRK